MKKAVIFDFDGTIANSRYVWQKVDVDFLQKEEWKYHMIM